MFQHGSLGFPKQWGGNTGHSLTGAALHQRREGRQIGEQKDRRVDRQESRQTGEHKLAEQTDGTAGRRESRHRRGRQTGEQTDITTQ